MSTPDSIEKESNRATNLARFLSRTRQESTGSSPVDACTQSVTTNLLSRLRDSEEGILRKQLYDERVQRARSHRMSRAVMNKMMDAIDKEDAFGSDEISNVSSTCKLEGDEKEGVFVREDDEWVDIDQQQPVRKFVIRFKWR